MTEKQGLTKAPRVALYARVSTDEQSHKMQLRDLEAAAKSRGWRVVGVFVDEGVSGGLERRPELDKLMACARAADFDIVAVWKFDRFARSTQHLLKALTEFRSLGIDFVSIHEGIDTSTPMGKMVFTFLAAIAEFERSIISVRVKAAMAHRKASGKPIGRQRRATKEQREAIVKLRAEGRSWRKIAMAVGLPRSTARRTHRDAVKGVGQKGAPKKKRKRR